MSLCPACGASVTLDRRRMTLIEGNDGEPWKKHDCPNRTEYMRECVCGFLVWIQADEKRLLHPSRQPHRPHVFLLRNAAASTQQDERQARWYEEERKRAGIAPPLAPPEKADIGPAASERISGPRRPNPYATAAAAAAPSRATRKDSLAPWHDAPMAPTTTETKAAEAPIQAADSNRQNSPD